MEKTFRSTFGYKAFRIAVTVLVGVLLFAALTKLCQPKYYFVLESKSPETEMWKSFYGLERDSLDILFLGSSHIYNSIDPEQFEERTGLRGFDMSTSNQDASLSYYLLRETLRYQKPKTVVMDLYGLQLEPMTKESSYKRTLDDMRWSCNKLEVIQTWLPHMEGETLLPRLFTLLDYHGRWNDLTDADINGKAYITSRRGFCPTDETAEGITHDKYFSDEEEHAFSETTLDYMRSIIELCRQNGMELILIKTPDTGWTAKWSEAARSLAGHYSLPYTDFNEPELLPEINLDDTTDWRNANHLNSRGAVKFTDYLADYLNSI